MCPRPNEGHDVVAGVVLPHAEGGPRTARRGGGAGAVLVDPELLAGREEEGLALADADLLGALAGIGPDALVVDVQLVVVVDDGQLVVAAAITTHTEALHPEIEV